MIATKCTCHKRIGLCAGDDCPNANPNFELMPNKPDINMEQEQQLELDAIKEFPMNEPFGKTFTGIDIVNAKREAWVKGRKASVSLSAQEQINSINEYFDTRENVKKFLRQHAKENCKDLYLKLCIDFNAKCKELKDLQLSISLDKKEIAWMFQGSWPLYDVLAKLTDAAEILLNNKNYDGHGWEEIHHCVGYSKELMNKLQEFQKSFFDLNHLDNSLPEQKDNAELSDSEEWFINNLISIIGTEKELVLRGKETAIDKKSILIWIRNNLPSQPK